MDWLMARSADLMAIAAGAEIAPVRPISG